jgi:asparagine synthetase B (glutamine-hydrolysing)
VTQPRNLVASYVAGRPAKEIERQSRALTATSSFFALPNTPEGWLVAVELSSKDDQLHTDAPELVTIEGPRGLPLNVGERVALARSTDALRRLPGEFAFCSFREGGELDAVRSCGGLVPLYYFVSEQAVCVATRLRDLYWLCPAELKPDWLVHSVWSAGNAVFPDQRTFFRDVKILPKGHVLRVRLGMARAERYWEPRPAELPEPAEDVQAAHARTLREALLRSLDDGLSPTGANLLTLSGGVDSSSVAVLGRRCLERPLSTLTFVAPRASKARARQLSFVEPLLDELAITSRFLVDAEDGLLDRLFATPLATLCYCPHPALRILPELQRGSFATLVSGHFADELCGYSQRLQDWMRHTRLAALLRPRPPTSYVLRDGMRWAKRRFLERVGRALLPLPAPLGRVFEAAMREEHAEWSRRTRARMLADRRPLRELAAWVELDDWVAMHWEVASVHGTRPIHPFFNREAIELGFECHPVELFGPGHKKILRRALSGVVPDRYLCRSDKGHWNRPARKDLASWDGELGALAGCVAPSVHQAGRLSHAERRQLTQLSLFAAALAREQMIRSTVLGGSG